VARPAFKHTQVTDTRTAHATVQLNGIVQKKKVIYNIKNKTNARLNQQYNIILYNVHR